MNTNQLVDKLSVIYGDVPPDALSAIVRDILDILRENLAAGHELKLRRFGSFQWRIRRGLMTWKSKDRFDRPYLHFQPCKELIEAIDNMDPEKAKQDFRKIWVHREGKSLMVPSCDLESYLAQGFQQGRGFRTTRLEDSELS